MSAPFELPAATRPFLEAIHDCLVVLDGAHRIAFATPAFASLAGVDREQLVGRSFAELVPAAERASLETSFENWRQSGSKLAVIEFHLQRADGRIRDAVLRGGWVESGDGRAALATVRDLTHERELECLLETQAARLAALGELSNAVNLSLTPEAIFEVAADEIRRLVAFDRMTIALLDDEGPGLEIVVVGREPSRHRAGFDRDAIGWALRRPMQWSRGGEEPPAHVVQGLLVERGMLAVMTVPLVARSRMLGSLNLGRRAAEAFTPADLGAAEAAARHVATALDTARLLAALKRRSHEFESLLEIGHGVLARLDLQELLPLVTRTVNRVMGTTSCLLMLREGDRLTVAASEGYERETVEAMGTLQVGESLVGQVALTGQPLFVYDVQSDPRTRFRDVAVRYGYRSLLCVPLLRDKETIGTLEIVTREPYRFQPVQMEMMVAFAAQAAVAIENARLFQEATRSLARTSEANRRLEELDQRRRDYLRNVSHEFRSPLTVIKGYAEFVRDGGASGGRALGDVMRVIVESCDRLIDLVETLIEVGRVEGDEARQSLQRRRVDLREMSETALEPLQGLAERKRILLSVQFPEEPLAVDGDRNLLVHVVRKLVDNAIKYSPMNGHVLLRGLHEDGTCMLEVEDFGVGIPAEHLPNIFEKFYVVDGGLSRKAGGTGVGLYLVREVVRLHDGSVDVTSEPGRGSLFRVRLPRSTDRAATGPRVA